MSQHAIKANKVHFQDLAEFHTITQNSTKIWVDKHKKDKETRIDVIPDALELIQKRFDGLTMDFENELKYWHDKKIEIAGGENFSDEHESKHHSCPKAKFKKFFCDVASFFEFPACYMKDLISRNKPQIDAYTQKLDELIKELSDATKPNTDKTGKDIKKIRLEICDTNIALIHTYQGIFNNINREIDYCIKWVKNLDTVIRALLLEFIRRQLPFPDVDLGIPERYRLTLFNMVHKHMENIENLAHDALGLSKLSKSVINKQAQQSSENTLKNNVTSDIAEKSKSAFCRLGTFKMAASKHVQFQKANLHENAERGMSVMRSKH